MPNSLKSQITSLRFKNKITIEEYEQLMKKLAGHDRELEAKATRKFADFIDSTPSVGIYDYYGNLITASGLVEQYEKENEQ